MRRNKAALLVGVLLAGLVVAQGMMGQPGQQDRLWMNPRGTGTGIMGPGMMGGMGMMGRGMMGGMGMMQVLPATATPLPAQELAERLEAAAVEFGEGARLADVMHFSNHSYAQVVDQQGRGVAELLVDRYTGIVTPEPGPNMMWNQNGHMSWAGRYPVRQADSRYDKDAATELANSFLSEFLPNARVMAGQDFAGYYTFDYGRGDIEGMLSVHAQTGQIWPHTWHGAYLGEEHDE